MKAWLKCPECGGVFGAPLGESTGECVFCGVTLRVNTAIEVVPNGTLSTRETKEPSPGGKRKSDTPEPLFVVRREGHADLIY